MRAWLLERYDGPDGLAAAEVPGPDPASGVILDVHAIGINFPDLLATKGQYQHKPPLPFVPGCEIAGVVASAPAGSAWREGDRAAAFVWDGGYAERAVVSEHALIALPDGVDFSTGAAMVVNYHTVWFALVRRGRMQHGETVLVLGAGGGIGSAAVQVARGLGARVIAGVANDAQRPVAAAVGADEVIVLDKGFSASVRELTGGHGVDLVLDPLGDWIFDEAVRALAPEGRILVVGFAAGEIPHLKVNRLLLRNASAIGVAWGAFLDTNPSIVGEAAATLTELTDAGVVQPHIGARYAFDDIPYALQRLERGEIPGKAVADGVVRGGDTIGVDTR